MDQELLDSLIEEAAVLYQAGDKLTEISRAAFKEQRKFIDEY